MHDRITKILVALCFSKYAQQTFDYAATLSQALKAELVIGNVISAQDVATVGTISASGYDEKGSAYIESVKKKRQQILETILEESPYTSDRIRLIFKVGNPVEKLLRIVVQEDVDLVVMGIKGRSDVNTVPIGSVAEKMFKNCPVPVVSFRDKVHAQQLRSRLPPP